MRVLRISHSANVKAYRERERALQARGVEVALVCPSDWQHLKYRTIRYKRNSSPVKFAPSARAPFHCLPTSRRQSCKCSNIFDLTSSTFMKNHIRYQVLNVCCCPKNSHRPGLMLSIRRRTSTRTIRRPSAGPSDMSIKTAMVPIRAVLECKKFCVLRDGLALAP